MHGTRAQWMLVVLVLAIVVSMGCSQSQGAGEGRANGATAATQSDGLELERALGEPLPGDPTVAGLDSDFIVPSQAAGVIDGGSEVTSAGEYRYGLPLRVPRGRAGIEPSLSLQYAGNAGDGRLGVGWSLVGLPEIRRCGSTRATEGRTDGVNYSPSDRFCLDGKKLVAIRGEYGGDDTEYRTEENSFARIVSYRDAGDSEPARFRVWSKDGRILDFGGPIRSNRIVTNRVLAEGVEGQPKPEGPRTVVWALRTMSDRVGNVMTVIYRQTNQEVPGAGVEYWPEQIGYVQQDEASEDPRQQRIVLFEYDNRPDPSFEYISGIRFNRTRRLRDIKNSVAGRSMGGYHLDYEVSGKTGRSLLSAVRQCDALGVCLSAKRFGWDTDPSGRRRWTEHVAPISDMKQPLESVDVNRFLVADMNGDGRDDIVYHVPVPPPGRIGEERVRLSEGDNFSGPMVWNSPVPYWVLPLSRPIDIDNDGITEIAAYTALSEDDPLGWYLFHPAGNKFVPGGPFIHGGAGANGPTVQADFLDADGDGRLDLFKTEWVDVGGGQREKHVFRSRNGDDPFAVSHDIGRYCSNLAEGYAPRVADVTANGRSEWIIGDCSGSVFALKSVGLASDGVTGTSDTTDMNLQVTARFDDFILVDVNGDNLRDAVFIAPSNQSNPSNHLRMRWNTGHGFGPVTTIPAEAAWHFDLDADYYPRWDLGMRVADVDGDGREDIVKFVSLWNDQRPRTRVFLSRGDHFVSYEVTELTLQARADAKGYGFVSSQLGDVNGDGMVDIITAVHDPSSEAIPLHVLINGAVRPDLMTEVTDEREDNDIRRHSELIHYQKDGSQSWGPTQHTTDIPCRYPQRCIKRGMPVVKELLRSTDRHGQSTEFNKSSYTYADARADMLGRGFLGFGEQTVVDEARGTTTRIRFDHATRDGTIYPFAGRPASIEETIQVSGIARTTRTTMNYTVNRYDGGLTYAVLPRQTQTIVKEGESVLRDDFFDQAWDSFGNEISHIGRTLGGIFSRTQTTMYTGPSYEEAWLVGLPFEKRVAETENSRISEPWDPLPTRTARYAWDANGQLTRVSIEPDKPDLQLSVEYAYTQGLVHQVRSFGADNVARTVTIDYDRDDVHPRRITNALGHVSWVRTHAGLDVPMMMVDPNGVATRYTYDGFGRVRSERGDDGHGADVDYGGRNSHPGTPETDREVTVAVRGGPRTITQFDAAGRPLFRSVETFDGRFSVTKAEYDPFGRIVAQTRPDFEAVSPHAPRLVYDSLDRPTLVTAPDGAQVRFSYSGLKTTVTDPAGNVVETLSDPHGRVIERAETSGLLRKSFYRYGDFGVLDAVQHSFQPATRFEYDGLGRMSKVVDPDGGTRAFAYNAFGEPKSDTNALGQTTEFKRDALGRMVARVDALGRTTYGWDTGAFALGKPVSSNTPDGVVTSQTYDSAGRPFRSATTVDGEVYASEQFYDEFGRLARRRYPVLGNTPFDATFSYTPTGHLKSIQAASGAPFFTVEARVADGQIERSRAGNGLASESLYDPRTGRVTYKRLLGASGTPIFDVNYAYDARGLVQTRSESTSVVSETFGYDAAERLTNYVRTSPGSSAGQTRTVRTEYGYDVLSNLTTVKRDGAVIETNEYNAQGKPHALAKMTTASGARTFTYDANGRQTETLAGSSQIERNIEYTPFDLPSMVHVRNNSQGDAEFRYNAYGQRVLKDYLLSSLTTIEGSYEARRCLGPRCSEPLKQVVYIPGEDGAAAQVEFDGDGSQTGVSYYQKDLLGSVGAVVRGNTVNDRLFYEPYGQRVTLAGDPLPGSIAAASSVRRGFTGHEHDDDLALVDMKGRMYDPLQRHFLTPDPYVTYAQGEYALRASVRSSNPLDWLGSSFEPLAPGAFVGDLPVASQLGRILAADDPPGAPGGVAAGDSDATGYRPTTVGRGATPARAGAVSNPPGAAPSGAKAGPNLVAPPSGADAIAPAIGTSSQWEAHHPYSYTYNNPTNYVDPSGYCPVCVGIALLFGYGTTLASDDAARQREAHPELVEHPVLGALASAGMLMPLGGVALRGAAAPATAEVSTATRGGAAAVRVGQAGEAAVRAVADIGPKIPIQVAGRTRIPDGLTAQVLTEVKNVASLSFTQQLRDFATYASKNGLRFDLWVRPTTQLSGPLVNEIANGAINLRLIP